MPNRQRKISDSPSPSADELRNFLVTARIDVPEKFEGSIEGDDLKDFQDRDQKTLLVLSIHGKWIDWAIDTLTHQDEMISRLDSEVARLKIEGDRNKPEKLLWNLLKWVTVLIAGGALAALGSRFIKGL